MDGIVNMLFSVDCNSLITASKDGLIATWKLPLLIRNGMQERKSELSGTHSIILNSFNELKQLQMHLPGGLIIDDLLNEDQDAEESSDNDDAGEVGTKNGENLKDNIMAIDVLESHSKFCDISNIVTDDSKNENTKDKEVNDKKYIDIIQELMNDENKNDDQVNNAKNENSKNEEVNDIDFIQKLIIDENDNKNDEEHNAEEQKDTKLKITLTTPSNTTTNVIVDSEKSIDANKVEDAIDEPIFIEQKVWKRENIVKHIKEQIMNDDTAKTLEQQSEINQDQNESIQSENREEPDNIVNEKEKEHESKIGSVQSENRKDSVINVKENASENELVQAENDKETDINRKEDENKNELDVPALDVDASVTSSIEIPSLANLLKSVEPNRDQNAANTKDNHKADLQQTKNGEINPMRHSTEDIEEILEQLKALETKELLMNTDKIVDIDIVVDGEGKNENKTGNGNQIAIENEEKTVSSTFPIKMKISIDTKEIISELSDSIPMPESNDMSIPTPPEREPSIPVDPQNAASIDSIKKSPRKRKLEEALNLHLQNGDSKVKALALGNSDSDKKENKNEDKIENEDIAPSNLIPWDEWEIDQRRSGSVSSAGIANVTKEVEEDGNAKEIEKDEEMKLLWNCFENNLSNFANSAQQLQNLGELLKMKGLTKEKIDNKIRKNEKMRKNLESIYGSIQWIKDIMIDADFSHTFM